jgi:hypothetical protein
MRAHSHFGSWVVLVASVAGAGPLVGQTGSPDQYQAMARAVLKELVEIKTTESGLGATPAAQAVARRLLAAGFPAADVKVLGPSPRKYNVVARIHGSGKAKPILLLNSAIVRGGSATSDEDPGRFFGGCLGVGPPRTRCHSELVHRQPARWRGGSRAPVVHTSADAGARPPIEVHGGIGSVRRLTRGEDDEYCDCVRRLRTGAGRHR